MSIGQRRLGIWSADLGAYSTTEKDFGEIALSANVRHSGLELVPTSVDLPIYRKDLGALQVGES
jgi:hypothetical protein